MLLKVPENKQHTQKMFRLMPRYKVFLETLFFFFNVPLLTFLVSFKNQYIYSFYESFHILIFYVFKICSVFADRRRTAPLSLDLSSVSISQYSQYTCSLEEGTICI